MHIEVLVLDGSSIPVSDVGATPDLVHSICPSRPDNVVPQVPPSRRSVVTDVLRGEVVAVFHNHLDQSFRVSLIAEFLASLHLVDEQSSVSTNAAFIPNLFSLEAEGDVSDSDTIDSQPADELIVRIREAVHTGLVGNNVERGSHDEPFKMLMKFEALM